FLYAQLCVESTGSAGPEGSVSVYLSVVFPLGDDFPVRPVAVNCALCCGCHLDLPDRLVPGSQSGCCGRERIYSRENHVTSIALDRKSTRLNSTHVKISPAARCLFVFSLHDALPIWICICLSFCRFSSWR